MSISATSSASSLSSSYASAAAPKSGGLDTNAFLRLMVKQLQNQNPLDPADSNQLLAQMVSYASYNEQASTASSLQDIASMVKTIASSLDIKV